MDTVESVGEFFRQVRETKGLTLDEVALKTRIHPEYLRALEESNFAKLPEQVFAKGFVRSYARSLGLDEDDVMRRFEASSGTFYNKHEERERLRQQQVEDERRRKANRKVVVMAVAVACLGLVLLLTREQSKMVASRPSDSDATRAKSSPTTPSNRETDRRVRSEGAGSAPSAGSGTASPAPAPSDRSTSQPVPATTSDPLAGLPVEGGTSAQAPMVLVLEASELSWVVVQVDDASPHEALLRPGERLTWKGQEKFTLTIGNAGGVRGELNGKPQGPFGPKGKVVRDIVLTR